MVKILDPLSRFLSKDIIQSRARKFVQVTAPNILLTALVTSLAVHFLVQTPVDPGVARLFEFAKIESGLTAITIATAYTTWRIFVIIVEKSGSLVSGLSKYGSRKK